MVNTQLMLQSNLESRREQPAAGRSYFSPSLEEWHRRLQSANTPRENVPQILTVEDADVPSRSLVAA